jgi:hypothetical protein
VGLHAHDVAALHWWFVPKFIFAAINVVRKRLLQLSVPVVR